MLRARAWSESWIQAQLAPQAVPAAVRTRALFFVGLAVVAVLLQLSAGAYAAERGAYSDEAAHFLNGLLLRDYLTQAPGQDPLRFAEEYYLSYPKIAPGVWPPFFHILLGLFLLPGWPPHAAALVLIALVTAHAAWRLSTLVVQFASPLAAALTAALFLLTPVVLDLSTAVMVDMVVASLMLEATHWFVLFSTTGRLRHAVLFGLAAAGCAMTKGNGVAIVLVPALFILITRRFSLLRRSGLYVAAVIVVLLAVPPLVVSYRFGLSIDDFGPVRWQDVAGRVQFYAGFIWGQLGSLPTVLGLVGLGAIIVRRGDNARPAVDTALASLACAVILFHVLTPYRYFGGRYAVVLIAPVLGLIPSGIAAAASLVPQWSRILSPALYLVTVLLFLVAYPIGELRRPLGYRAAAGFLEARNAIAGNRLLVVSDEHGEGAFVAEVAVRPREPRVTIVRGSKLLSEGDWIGTDFGLRYPAPSAITRELEDLHMAYVLVDSSPGDASPPHWRVARDQMAQAIAMSPDRYERVYSVRPTSDHVKREIDVYRLRYQSPGPPKVLRLDLRSSLGKVLER